jgi:DEAD/DEAH box helicase domain-containing protein
VPGSEKSADGLQALRWWKEGRIDEIINYCKMDVKITRDLFYMEKRTGTSFLITNPGIQSVFLSTGNKYFPQNGFR